MVSIVSLVHDCTQKVCVACQCVCFAQVVGWLFMSNLAFRSAARDHEIDGMHLDGVLARAGVRNM